MNIDVILVLLAVARHVVSRDPIGFLTLVLLVIWFLRDQFGGLFKATK